MRAVVTGATRGIGRAVVEHLVADGWQVLALARDPQALGALVAELGDHVEPYVGDVTDIDSLDGLAAAAGQVDLVVANAGVFLAAGRFWEADLDAFWRGFSTNVLGAAAVLHRLLPGMVARGSGRTVIVSSGVGNRPGPWQASYASSKAAATRLGESLDLELAGTGVRCFVVSPGLVRTGMTDRWPDEMLRFLPEWGEMPEENYKPVSLLLELLDAVAEGEVDDLSGRFLHATDDRVALRAAVASRERWDDGGPPDTATARRARTLRMWPAEDGDPLST